MSLVEYRIPLLSVVLSTAHFLSVKIPSSLFHKRREEKRRGREEKRGFSRYFFLSFRSSWRESTATVAATKNLDFIKTKAGERDSSELREREREREREVTASRQIQQLPTPVTHARPRQRNVPHFHRISPLPSSVKAFFFGLDKAKLVGLYVYFFFLGGGF